MPQAKVAAMKAIELDKTLGEAYASLAQIRFYYDWDWTEAARNYQQAVRLSPTYPTAHQWYGEYLLAMGRTDEGLAELKRARDLDPLSLIINTDLGLAFYWAQRYDLAIEQLERTIELEPSFFRAHLHLGMAYERKRMYGEAIAELETARRLNENAWTLAGLGYAFASFGEKAEAEKLLEQLLELSQARYVSSAAIAVVYAGFGDQVNQTLEWLEKAYSERSGLLAWINVWPIFDRIRSDGRFADLLRRIGFPSCPATGTQEQPIVVPADAPRRVFISSAAAIGDNGKPTVEFGGPFYEPTHNVKSNGILEVRDEIASGASARLVVESTGAREAQAAEGYTENSAAYRSYLKGRYYWSKYTQPALHKAIDCFREAVGLDPGYALAYVGMADSYTRLATSYISPAEGVPRAKAALSRALQINDNLAEAHATLGKLKMDYDWDWDGAEQEFRRAFQLKPDYATAHLWYGTYLESIGRLDDALIEKKRALELDPLSSHINVSLGSTLWLMHQWDEALETSRETIEMDDNFVPAHLLSGVANELSRNFPRSVANLEKACEIDHSPIILAGLGRAYSVAGRGEKAKAIIKKLQAQSRRGYVSPYSIALIMSGLGAIDTALDWLQKAYEGHDEWLFWLRVDPRLDQLRSYDRFKDLEGRVFGSQLHSRDNSVF
jgi:tetratricopeptide (TPR) repeat protein